MRVQPGRIRSTIAVSLDARVVDELDRFAARVGATCSRAVEAAIACYLGERRAAIDGRARRRPDRGAAA